SFPNEPANAGSGYARNESVPLPNDAPGAFSPPAPRASPSPEDSNVSGTRVRAHQQLRRHSYTRRRDINDAGDRLLYPDTRPEYCRVLPAPVSYQARWLQPRRPTKALLAH